MNILFTNAGRRTYLIEYALDLMKQGYEINVFVCDTTTDTAAMFVSDDVRNFITPRVSDSEEKYFEILLQQCLKNEIKIIIPLMDFELPVLAKNKSILENHGIKVWVSDFELILNCLDKKRNVEFCKKNDIPMPETYFKAKAIKYPLVKKKIQGSGSVGLEIFKNEPDHLNFIEGEDMLQVFIAGKEIGMDIFNDYEGNYVHSCYREKLLMRAGETDKARSFFDPMLEQEAKRISKLTRHVGNLDIDLILTLKGEIYYIDFNPRFGGGYPFTHLSGANYIKYIIEESLGLQPQTPVFEQSISGMKGISLYMHT